MKAYKITLLFIDHDQVGAAGAKRLIEDARLPNHISPGHVMDLEVADIGEWDDDHLLNNGQTQHAEFARLFPYDGDYDKLYKEWRVKNEACNLAYAITIPALNQKIESLRESLIKMAREDRPVMQHNNELTLRARAGEEAAAAMAKAHAYCLKDRKALEEELADVREELRQAGTTEHDPDVVAGE